MARRKLVWARQVTTWTNQTTVRFNPFFDFEAAWAANVLGITVVRIRGSVQAYDTDGSAVGQGVIGMRVTTRDALSTVSGPVTEPHADWMMWEPFPIVLSPTEIMTAHAFDVKSMRKIDEVDQAFVCAIQTPQGSTGALHTSCLLMLP